MQANGPLQMPAAHRCLQHSWDPGALQGPTHATAIANTVLAAIYTVKTAGFMGSWHENLVVAKQSDLTLALHVPARQGLPHPLSRSGCLSMTSAAACGSRSPSTPARVDDFHCCHRRHMPLLLPCTPAPWASGAAGQAHSAPRSAAAAARGQVRVRRCRAHHVQSARCCTRSREGRAAWHGFFRRASFNQVGSCIQGCFGGTLSKRPWICLITCVRTSTRILVAL